MSCRVRHALVLLFVAAFVLVGCGGGVGGMEGRGPVVIRGTAAAGAPIVGGAVSMVGANGRKVFATTDAKGEFALLVTDLTPPVLVKVVSGAVTLFGWTDAPGIVNLTPLTTAALVLTDLPDNLIEVFDNWPAHSGNLNRAALRAKQAIVNVNFAQRLTDAGLDPKTYDFAVTPFVADGSGIDGLLDDFDFSFNYASEGGFAGVVAISGITFDPQKTVPPDYCIGCDDGEPPPGDTTPPTVCISHDAAVYTFDLGPSCHNPILAGYLGAENSTYLTPANAVSPPADSHGRIVKVVRSASADQFAGTVVILDMPLKIPFTASAKKMSVRVWSPVVGIKVQLKVDNGTDFGVPGAVFDIAETLTTSTGWQTLTFDFERPVFSNRALILRPGESSLSYPPINLAATYDRVALSFNVGVFGAVAGEQTFYFDEISFPKP